MNDRRTIEDLVHDLLKSPLIDHVSLFGSFIREHEDPLDISLSELSDMSSHEVGGVDVDMIIVGNKYEHEFPMNIIKILRPHGLVIFHPDFYLKRPQGTTVFEIIALPSGSRWLAITTLGRLIGLSILHGGYIPVHHDLGDHVEMPEEPVDMRERLQIVLSSYAGLTDVYSKLWAITWTSFASQKKPDIDINRIIKWMLCDTVWAVTGSFFFDKEKLLRKARTVLPAIVIERCIPLLNDALSNRAKTNHATLEAACDLVKDLIFFVKSKMSCTSDI